MRCMQTILMYMFVLLAGFYYEQKEQIIDGISRKHRIKYRLSKRYGVMGTVLQMAVGKDWLDNMMDGID